MVLSALVFAHAFSRLDRLRITWYFRQQPTVRVWGLLVLLVGSGFGVEALAPLGQSQTPLSSFTLQTFSTRDGLPLNYVPSMVQDDRGFLWFGGAEGVTRFDGAVFEALNQDNLAGLSSNSIGHLALVSDGSLWLGTAGGGVFRLRGGEIVEEIAATSLPNPEVTALWVDPTGSLWVGTPAGLCQWDGEEIRVFGVDEGLPSDWIGSLRAHNQGMAVDSSGRLWVIASGMLAVRTESGFRRVPLGHDEKAEVIVSTSTGELWIGTNRGRAGGVSDLGFEPRVEIGVETSISALVVDPAGSVWLGTPDVGLYRWDGQRVESIALNHGVADNRILSMLLDREGFLWVGTYTGLLRLDDSLFSFYDRGSGFSDPTVIGLSDGVEGLWAVLDDGSLFQFSESGWTARLRSREDADQREVRRVLEARDGTVWIAGSRGLFRWNEGELQAVSSPAGEEGVTALFEDSRGALWVGMTQGGVHRLTPEGTWRSWGETEGLEAPGIYTFAERKDGGLWVGTRAGLVFISSEDSDRVQTYGCDEGLCDELLVSLYEDPHGVLWVGTVNDGLVRFLDGEFRPIAKPEGLPSNSIWSIVEDDGEFFWLSSNKGVSRVARSDLMRAADREIELLPVVTYGPSEGLLEPDCVGGFLSAGIVTDKGEIAFATAQGVAVVHEPERASSSPPPPSVFLLRVEVDDRVLSLVEPIELAAGDRRVEMRVGSPTMISGHAVRMRYRLAGFEDGWRDLSERREVTFTNLPPGRFAFEVSSSRDGIVWSSPLRWGIEVPRLWYESPPFYLMVAFALGLMMYGSFRIRLRQAEARELALAVVVEERTEDLRVANRQLEDRNLQLAELSVLDPLTGLANRRRLEQALDREWRRMARLGQPLSLLMVDVDEFKNFNDSKGHLAGDRCLKAVAALLHSISRRPGDLVARYGGEEFVVLLPGSGAKDAIEIAERSRRRVERASIDHPGSSIASVVTVSIGVATRSPSTAEDDGSEQLLEGADQALYRAKRSGRNRVVDASE